MMPRIAMLRAIASAEMRSTRRLARYWVFLVIALIVSTVSFGQMAVMHGLFSHHSATVGSMSPRFLVSNSGLNLVFTFLVGMIFIAYDVRARDVRERMAEVLDSRPITNLEFLLGRSVGLVTMMWIPSILVCAILQGIGVASGLFAWSVGETIEPWSLIGFIAYAFTTLALWCAMVVLLTMVARFRILVAALALALMGAQAWVLMSLPIGVAQTFSLLPTFELGSDLVPSIMADDAWVRIFAQLTFAAGCIGAAAALHPRTDDGNRQLQLGGAAVLIAAGVGFLFTQKLQFDDDQAQFGTWESAHRAVQSDPIPDVVRVTGNVTIDPGSNVALDLVYSVRARDRHESLIFSLNPGLQPARISIDGSPADFTFNSGVLKLSKSLAPEQRVEINFVIEGSPLSTFGYLDSTLDLLSGSIMDSQALMLGHDVSLNRSGYVALMPGGYWMPTAGSGVPGSDPRTNPVDHFEVDVSVGVPNGWLVAGPGLRNPDGARVRFNPPNPVAPFGLLASRFERYAIEVRGVTFELLLNAGHTRNLATFDELAPELENRLGKTLDRASELGLPYPYKGLTLVEIPNRLRGYAGGWRLDTTQALPGTMLLRETSFPTARFNVAFDNEEATAEAEASEDGIEGFKLRVLERFFENDFSGGNPFQGASRNFFAFQTSAHGESALALNFVLEELVNLLITQKRGYFSAHEYDNQSSVLIGQTMTELTQGRTESVVEAITRAATDRPSVWDRALGDALAELNPDAEPREVLNVLSLKSRAFALAILDGLGEADTARLLATLLELHRGDLFTEADFLDAAETVGVDIRALLGDWLNDAALPGFIASEAASIRLRDDDSGNPRYQTTFHLRNDEPVPGLLRIRYKETGEDPPFIVEGPFRVESETTIEIGVVSSLPLAELNVSPYLSLNRTELKLAVPTVDTESEVDQPQFIGMRDSAWQPAPTDDIIVDDLDAGFSIVGAPDVLPARAPFVRPPDMDQGMPEYESMFGLPSVWSRAPNFQGYGKYRKTLALVSAGEGDQKAVFSTDLPAGGQWRIALYIAEDVGPQAENQMKGALGEYTMNIVTGGESKALEFDASAAEPGWNTLSEMRLEPGETRVEISNKTSGRAIVADAIRWRQVN